MRQLQLKKRNSTLSFIFLLCFVLLNAGSAFAQKQTKKDLEKKKQQLQKEIENTNQLLVLLQQQQRKLTELNGLTDL